ncbi:predicted protein [Chaetomium globosum CBS 148.51]|uniref:F-box domain-containing protein n=1 Tax=Chaetomium globosum (strain ATCC 6205 / CBS 148.51 / DSM 1962 / NBRC 6347 / NRRL 1970) TaxID=306901 RepID=Q2GSY7_CHAGB|nr:uncharacterized protein CHGG_08917 [Chaetomium globosum CBS 148.51]EAQ84903.1 predicted protein [Chaetomium globosum CBS 148.51]
MEAPSLPQIATAGSVAEKRERIASISAVLVAPPCNISRRQKLRSPLENSMHDPTYTKATPKAWTFYVHADCWDLVACRVANPTACATAFCNSLLTTYRDHITASPISTSQPRLSSGSPRLTTTPTPPGRNARRANMHQLDSFDGLAAELGLEHLPSIHEPISLEQLNLFSSTTAPTRRPLTHTHTTTTNNPDPFSTLPPELLHLLAEHTPTPTLLHLRIASRAVASVSGLASLPRSFWRSRFGPAFEMGFALPARVERELDWRGLYFLMGRGLRRYCGEVGGSRGERPLLARLAKRRFWWARLGKVVGLGVDGGLCESFV